MQKRTSDNNRLTTFILPARRSPHPTRRGIRQSRCATPNAQFGSKPERGHRGSSKMIVEAGPRQWKLDLNRLNGVTSMNQKFEALHFDVTANSFFSILVFNDLLRGPEQGSMALIPLGSSSAGVNDPGYSLPAALAHPSTNSQSKKLPSGEQFDLAVRDAKTGFIFFNIEGHQ